MINSKHLNARHLIKVVIVITILLILFLTPTYSHADSMKWSIVDTPDSTNKVIMTPSEVNSIVASYDGSTLYAIDISTPNSRVYRSRNGGFGWDDISSYITSAGGALPVWNIALAPDNPNVIAVVASQGGLPGSVYLSIDAGNSWQNLNCPATSGISSLDISRNYGGVDIVIGTRTGAGNGKIFTCKLANIGSWADQGFNGDVIAAKFSPNYGGDNTLIIISANAAGTFLNIGFRDVAANSSRWNMFSPIEITVSGAGSSPKFNQIKVADIEIPFDFLGQSPGQRRIFISTDDGGATGNGGIYRVDDTLIYKIMATTGAKRISSIAYYGSVNGGKLLAGEVKSNPSTATVDIWYCLNPEATCPQSSCIFWQKSVKPPTGGANSGNANAQVLWSPDGITAYCGTSAADLTVGVWPVGLQISQPRDESAFSITRDGGKTWNQISLTDTEITFLSDVSTTLYSDVIYLASINTHAGNNGFDSVWRSTSFGSTMIWERVFCILTTSNDVILRMNPAKNDQVFLGIRSGSNLFQSTDKGQIWIDTIPGVTISDFSASELNNVPFLHILSNNIMRRGEYTGTIWRWALGVNTGLGIGHTIFTSPAGVVVIGDTGGMVSYSTNNGASFTSITFPVPAPGKVHVLTDYRIQNYLVLYAASDDPAGKIYGFIPGVTAQWADTRAPGQRFYGLAQLDTFYGAWFSGANNAVARTLNPQDTLLPQGGEWDTVQVGLSPGIAFTREPTSLKASGGINLWAIDNKNYTTTQGRLWNFSDGLASGPPAILSTPNRPSKEQLFQAAIAQIPADGTIISLDEKERVPDIAFRWNHPLPANGYDLWIASDKEFNKIIFKKSLIPDAVMSPKYILTTDESSLEPGKTYYWKVRVNKSAITYEKGEGTWSTTLSFSTAPGSTLPSTSPAVTAPVPLSPQDRAINIAPSPEFLWSAITGATEYEFVLAEDKDFQQPLVKTTVNNNSFILNKLLKQNTTYYWQVKTTRPTISQPGPVFSFTVISEKLALPPSSVTEFPVWVWIIFGIILALAITVPIIIFLSTRPSRTKLL